MIGPGKLLFCALISTTLLRASSALADQRQVHTALVKFDACLPLADGRVLAGSAGGLVVIDESGTQRARFTAVDGLPGTRIHSLAQSQRGDKAGIWVGTDKGAALVSLDRGGMQIHESFASKAVRDLLVTGDTLYAATWGQGLLRYGLDSKPGSLEAVHHSPVPRQQRVTSVAIKDGHLWWTTAGAGLWHKPMQGRATAQQSRVVAPNSVLWSLDAHGGELWIGGEEGVTSLAGKSATKALRSVRATTKIGGQRYAASFGTGLQPFHKAAQELPTDRFARSLRSAHGVTCLGTEEALWIRRSRSWRLAKLEQGLPANDIAAFVSDGVHTYAGTFEQGVAKLENGHFVPLKIEIDPHVNALAIDKRSGALWIGTSSSLVLYDENSKDKQVTHFGRGSGLASRHVMSLFALPGGGVLVGTAAGAAVMHDGVALPVGGKGGLTTGNVWAVAQSADGTQWLGTTRGVFRVLKDEVTRYRVASGELQDDWVMALAVADDGVFVGTYKAGVVRLVIDGNTVRAQKLGEGWINPSGLHWDGHSLRAATMHGAFIGDGELPAWRKRTATPGMDTTAFMPTKAGGEWIVTRRGLVKASSAN